MRRMAPLTAGSPRRDTNTRRDTTTRRDAITRVGAALVGGAAAPGVCAWLSACGPRRAASGDGARIVAYISADDALAREVLAACTRETGVEIDAVFDTEATKTTGLESRIRSERDRPRCDLFWSSEGFAVTRLASEGLLAEVSEPVWSAWPAVHRDPARRWLAFAARARVVVTHERADPVERWGDLAAPGLARGSASAIAVADPRFGTTNGHFAALKLAWDRARAAGVDAPDFHAWLDGMRSNGVRVLTGGNAATVEAVATGESAFGLTDSDDALAAIARGLPLRMHVPRSLAAGVRGGGTMLVPNTVALVAGGPASKRAADSGDGRTSEAAQRVAAYLVSPACEALIARSPSRNLPLGPAVAESVPFGEPDALEFDAAEAARIAPALAVEAKARLESNPVACAPRSTDGVRA